MLGVVDHDFGFYVLRSFIFRSEVAPESCIDIPLHRSKLFNRVLGSVVFHFLGSGRFPTTEGDVIPNNCHYTLPAALLLRFKY